MAILRQGRAKCSMCKSFKEYSYFNRNWKSLIICKECKPIARQNGIDNAIKLLLQEKVTPEEFEQIYSAHNEKVGES